MFSPKARSGQPGLFSSSKTTSAIPARHAAVREALVQASLDPAVRAIGHLASAHAGATQVAVEAVILTRDDGRFHLDVVPARKVRDLEDEGLILIALAELGLRPFVVTAEELKREPRGTNCRLVWPYREHPVPIPLRLRILQILMDDGPMQLSHLLEAVRADRDPSPAVLSLACADLLELDLASEPLGPATMARVRT
jgi:hypothetical protein